MKWKALVADYLTFTRRERMGILALISLILIIFLLPRFINNKGSSQEVLADTAWIAAAKKLEIKEGEFKNRSYASRNDNDYQYYPSAKNFLSPPKSSLFYFDPNTLDQEGWKQLGLNDKTIHIIQNYLSKGGHFYKPEDLQKIYGLRPADYSRLAPYVKIESGVDNKRPEYIKNENTPNSFSNKTIDVNSADTSGFISLPGIGHKLAARIINFRDRLGGFYSIEQVGETYGLPDSSFQKLKPYLKIETAAIKKININTATLEELKGHPYIKYNIANPIIAYRNEHGPFSKSEVVKKVMVVTDEIYNKIEPYITTQ
jgi:competence protein ComEA